MLTFSLFSIDFLRGKVPLILFVVMLLGGGIVSGQTQYFDYELSLEKKYKGNFNANIYLKEGGIETKIDGDFTSGRLLEVDMNKTGAKELILKFESPSLVDKKHILKFALSASATSGLLKNTSSGELKEKGKAEFKYGIQGVEATGKIEIKNFSVDCNGTTVRANKTGTKVPFSITINYKIIPKEKNFDKDPKVTDTKSTTSTLSTTTAKPIETTQTVATSNPVVTNKTVANPEDVELERKKAEEAKKDQEKAEADAKEKAKSSTNPEDIAWSSALSTNTVEAYRSFLMDYPASSRKTQANQFIKVLENKDRDEKLWSEVKNAKTEAAFDRYLKGFPAGIHAAEAKVQKEKIKKDMSGKDPDEEQWKSIDKSVFSQLKGYLTDFASGKHKAEAEGALRNTKIAYASPDSVGKSATGDSTLYRVTLKDVWGTIATPSIANGKVKETTPDESANTVQLEIMVPCAANSKAILNVTDALGRSTKAPIEIQCGQKKFTALVVEKNKDGKMILNIMGGFPQYTVQFRQNGTVKYDFTKPDKNFIIDLSDIKAGKYEVVVLDSKKTYETEPIQFEKKAETPWGLIIGGILAVIAGIGGFILYRKRQQKQRAEIAQKVKSKNQVPSPKEEEKAAKIHKIQKSEINVEKTVAENPVENKSKISIKSTPEKERKVIASADFLTPDKEKEYYSLDMAKLWADSAVATVKMHRTCINDLSKFLAAHNDWENTNKVANLDEESGDIPEIGGFILGKPVQNTETEIYSVYLDLFIPIESNNQNVYQIEFGTHAWNYLDDKLAAHPDLQLIAWFHTHPGHGLFLSEPDLKIHEGFFKEKYHLAMEIDSKKQFLDTAFFTRKIDGTVNNVENLVAGAEWFRWTEIEPFKRKIV